MTKLSKPIPVLRYEFIEFLKQQKITKFSTKNLMEWYEWRMIKLKKKFNKQAAYPAIHKQVIYTLLHENKISRLSRGIYEIVIEPKVKQSKQQKQTTTNLDAIAEEKWAKLSGKSFDPDILLDKDTLGRIKK